MKISRPADDQQVKLFGELCGGDCFEFGSNLYVKIVNVIGDALLLAGADTRMARFMPDDQCILVDVEISYTYSRPEKG